jgi:hypothetical protein
MNIVQTTLFPVGQATLTGLIIALGSKQENIQENPGSNTIQTYFLPGQTRLS